MMEFFLVLVVVILIGGLVAMGQQKKAGQGGGTHICATCGTRGTPTQRDKGSGLIELVLWLCFIIPGILYSIWRRSGLSNCCRSCGSGDIIPIDSPRGRKLAAEFDAR
jgi:hypothetical protein